MTTFNLDNYITVNDRIVKFWKEKFEPENSDGRIETEIYHLDSEEASNRMVVIKASVYIGNVLIATGLAKEREGTGGANRTSFIENAETSAIGRALANMGFLVEKARPSREEMEAVKAVESAHTETLAEIKVIALESNDKPTQGDVRKNWKSLSQDPVFATKYLGDLKDRFEIVEETDFEE